MSFAGFFALAIPAHASEIADCAHDRFLEAYSATKHGTIADVAAAAIALDKACLGDSPSRLDRDEFTAGVDRALGELRQ
jgi:hypothetical protein